MTYLWITLTTLSILSQIPHAYWSINKYSQIEQQWLAIAQNIAFCSIISLGILGFVLEGLHWYAFGGAVVEIIINFYYYDKQAPRTSFKDKFRKDWLAYFLAVLIPMTIFIFSQQINN
jgi:peptidoglycan biosynthesis protein MviN/MurJ (putative lipid II flippase)